MQPGAVLVAFLAVISLASGCLKFGKDPKIRDSYYCICDSDYCDEAPSIVKTKEDLAYTMVSSNRDGLRFQVTNGTFGNNIQERVKAKILVDVTKTYQSIIGFGGSLTDSVGINIKSLSDPVQEKLLGSYFGPGSIEYNLIRTPMGASDFSPRPYSYAMVENDIFLDHFSLVDEDHRYKIPYLHKINSTSKREIKLIASPWTPSPWMRTTANWMGKGTLRREYWKTWADYFVKFFEAYKKEGINFWAMTPQNEPEVSFWAVNLPSMGWHVNDQREWITKFLGPVFKKAGLDIKIIIGDDMRQLLPHWIKKILMDNEANKLVSGIGIHWYLDSLVSVKRLDKTHNLFPDKFMLYTESSCGVMQKQPIKLGTWSRGEKYANSIIETLSHWVTGWIDWNMALDLKGGPSWNKNYIDAPILVNASADAFYKQPTYYAIGHFSKFVPPGSQRISTSLQGHSRISSIGFLTPDNATVLVILNKGIKQQEVLLKDIKKGSVKLTLTAKSINSVIYW